MFSNHSAETKIEALRQSFNVLQLRKEREWQRRTGTWSGGRAGYPGRFLIFVHRIEQAARVRARFERHLVRTDSVLAAAQVREHLALLGSVLSSTERFYRVTPNSAMQEAA